MLLITQKMKSFIAKKGGNFILRKNYIIGIDEAGRGPLAGAVYVGAVMLPKNHKQLFKKTNAPQKLADSKKLSSAKREEWFLWIQKNVSYAYANVSAKKIDKINIVRACDVGAQRAFNKLITKNKILKTKKNSLKVKVIADGGLTIFVPKNVVFQQYPKADELVPAVSLASIVAKVTRDRYMQKMHKKFPQYGFDAHKGYGTQKHYKALRRYGPSALHRLTFLSSLRTMHRKK